MIRTSTKSSPLETRERESLAGFDGLGQGKKWGLLIASWTLFGLFFASQDYIRQAYTGRPLQWGKVLGAWVSVSLAWALLTPLIFLLARRFPFERGRTRKSVFVHLASSILFSITEILLFLLLAPLFGFSVWKGSFRASFTSAFTIDFHINVLIYFAILCVAQALDYYRKYRERELKALQLEAKSSQLQAQLAQAHLSALKMQLHPHFLFNTLNTIVVLIRKRRDQEAEDMLTGLSELLRYALDNMGVQEVTLRRELEFIDRYLDIEQVRFNDRLEIRTRIDDETLDALVPNLVLQPLVENAIRHGFGKRAEAGLIEISAKRDEGDLHIGIRDDGSGLSKGGIKSNSQGIGIANTRARLQRLYGVAHSLTLSTADGGGTIVALRIPFHLTEVSAGGHRKNEED